MVISDMSIAGSLQFARIHFLGFKIAIYTCLINDQSIFASKQGISICQDGNYTIGVLYPAPDQLNSPPDACDIHRHWCTNLMSLISSSRI